MADPIDMEEGDRDLLAAEHALGVLEGEERAVAQRLMLTDQDFAERVRWWSYRLAGMAEEAGTRAPSEQVWRAIERRLDGSEGGEVSEAFAPAAPAPLSAPRGFSGWTLAGAMAGAAAVAAAVMLLVGNPAGGPTQPLPAPVEAPERRLVAQAQSEDGAISLTSLVEQRARRISLSIAGLEPGSGRAPELWIVPAGGAPRSLGQVPEGGSFSRDLTDDERHLLVPGSSLAVTYEDRATIPNPAPTGDILVLGSLSEV